jgi:hypothetical protein
MACSCRISVRNHVGPQKTIASGKSFRPLSSRRWQSSLTRRRKCGQSRRTKEIAAAPAAGSGALSRKLGVQTHRLHRLNHCRLEMPVSRRRTVHRSSTFLYVSSERFGESVIYNLPYTCIFGLGIAKFVLDSSSPSRHSLIGESGVLHLPSLVIEACICGGVLAVATMFPYRILHEARPISQTHACSL